MGGTASRSVPIIFIIDNQNCMVSLIELKEYLKDRNVVSLNDLGLHFKVSAETLEPMLEQWIRKGKLRKESSGGSCGEKHSACSCGGSRQSWYQWIG